MSRLNLCLSSSRLRIALALIGLVSLQPPSEAAPPAETAFHSRHDALTNSWQIDLQPRPATPAESRAASPLSTPSLSTSELQPGCDWNFAPANSPHPETFGEHIWPDIAIAPDGSTALAWMDDHDGGTFHIYYSTSTDGGATWSTPEPVDRRTTGETSRFIRLEITPAGIPVAVWEDDRAGALNIYLSKRDPQNGGTPWTPPLQINTQGSPPFDYPMHPSLAVLDDLRFFVAWTDWREGVFNQVYMRSTTDGGNTWGPETRISDGLGYEPLASDPCLIVEPSSGAPGAEILHCATNDWRGNVPTGRYPNVFYYRSTDGGAHWTVGVQVNDIEPRYQNISPHSLVLLEDGTLTVGWFHWVLSPPEFRAAVSTDMGQTWSPSIQGEPDIGSGVLIHAVGNQVFASFSLQEGDLNAYVRHSSDGGRTWIEPACRMDDGPSGDQHAPLVVAVSPDEIQAAWWDNRPGLAAWKIFTARGTRASTGVDSPDDAHGSAPRPGALSAIPNPSSCLMPVRIVVRGAASEGADERSGWLEGADLRFGVYDTAGRRLRVLPESASGTVWDGADASGRLVPPGVYWVKVEPLGAAGAATVNTTHGAARIVRIR